MLEEALVVGGIACSFLSGRTSIVMARGIAGSIAVRNDNLILMFLGALGNFAWLALCVYGFIELDWYWPVIGLVVGFILTLLVTQVTVGPLWSMRGLLWTISTGCAGYLWYTFFF